MGLIQVELAHFLLAAAVTKKEAREPVASMRAVQRQGQRELVDSNEPIPNRIDAIAELSDLHEQGGDRVFEINVEALGFSPLLALVPWRPRRLRHGVRVGGAVYTDGDYRHLGRSLDG